MEFNTFIVWNLYFISFSFNIKISFVILFISLFYNQGNYIEKANKSNDSF